MTLPKSLKKRSELNEWCVLSGYRGSIAHGMYVPNSDPNSIDDKDVMAVCVPPVEYYYGLSQFGSRGTKEIKEGEWDIVAYECKKYIRMLEKANPNVLALLWLESTYYIQKTEVGDLLIKNRALFSTKNIYKSFVGYAYGQMHRMTHHAFQGYMGAKRKQLVEKFGYDTKNAAHLVRLLRMGIEFLTTRELNVLRQDAQQLLEIKRGEWTLEQVKVEATRLFKLSEEAFVRSKLPDRADHGKINKLCIEMISNHMKSY